MEHLSAIDLLNFASKQKELKVFKIINADYKRKNTNE